MKIHNNNTEIESHGALSQGTFSIKQSSKAFKILSSSLYKNKILAIIRELSCNAYDAHVDNNIKDLPFDIQLPTALEPSFKIRDYGKGISHEDMLELYTTYFSSTKTNSNEFIGALGLGSKSPFSYVNSFNINSYHNGMLRSYSAFINDEGLPNIVLLMEINSHDKSGLEVEFIVNSDDMYSFKSNSTIVYQYFKTKPNMLCDTELRFDVYDILYYGNNWKIDYRSKKAKAIQGNISYPISYESIPNFPQKYKYLLNISLEINFKIGSLDIAASREELSYDKETCSFILKTLSKIHDELLFQIKRSIVDDTYWKTLCNYNDFKSKSWLNLSILDNLDIFYKDKLVVEILGKDISPITKKFRVFGENARGKQITTRRYSNNSMIKLSNKTGIVFNDIKTRFMPKLRKYKLDNNFLRVYEFSIDPNEDNVSYINSIIEFLGYPDYEFLSNINIDKIEYNAERTYNIEVYQKLNYFEKERITKSELKELKDVYYVKFSGNELDDRYEYDTYNFSTLITKAKNLNYLDNDVKIFGLNKRSQNLVNMDNCINVIDYIKDKVYNDALLSSYKNLTSIPDYNIGYLYRNSSTLIEYKVDDPIFKLLLNHYSRRISLLNIENLTNFISIIEILYITFEDIECDQNYHDILLERYPLLSKISNSELIPELLFEHYVEYMNFKYHKSIQSD